MGIESEPSSATRGFFALISVWTASATASIFVFGYFFEQSKFDHLGIKNTAWLSTSDIFGAVRDSAFSWAVIAAFWVVQYLVIFHGILPKDAKDFAQEAFFSEGPIKEPTASATKRVANRIGGITVGLFLLAALSTLILNWIFNLGPPPDGSLSQTLGLIVFGIFALAIILSAWLELLMLMPFRLFRIFLTASALASAFGFMGSFFGQYSAGQIKTAPMAEIELFLDSGPPMRGVVADVLSAGYLIRTQTAHRMLLIDRSAVKRVWFLPSTNK